MTPKHFAALAVAAVVSAVAAIAVYSSSVQWSQTREGGEALFAQLPQKAGQVAEIEIAQGDKTIELVRDGDVWVLKEHESFPASAEKVDALLAGLGKAELVEAKTRKADRYALLGVEDPKTPEAKSVLVRLLDKDGAEIAAAIVGERRYDASGLGTSGTYVRKPGDDQAWLADAEIEAGAEFADWVNPQIFEARREDVTHLTVQLPGEEPLEIEPAEDRPGGHTLADIPEGKKLKYVNIVDEIVRAARTMEFSDVRKARDHADDETVSTVILEVKGGLKTTYRFRQDGDAFWLTLEASGEGDSEKVAEALMARAEGWEFKIPKSRVDEILKRRKDLLEEVSS